MIMKSDFESLDLIGVGIGPFNMSLAALLSPLGEVDSKFFDARKSFVWHAGQLMPDAEIQVSYLKDLVTLVDPTNPYSFLAYLRNQKRLYRFINSRFNNVLRMEFNQYLQWVSENLANLNFDEGVQDIKFTKCGFVVSTSKRIVRGKHLSLGSGLSPNIPESAKPFLGNNVYHIKDFLNKGGNWLGKKVLVVGGGQSGAEAVQSILADSNNLPQQLTWLSSRDQFAPIDDSVFANEIFTPGFSEYFFALSTEKKLRMIEEQTLASDGISMSLLDQIYRRLYVLECVQNRPKFVKFAAGHKLTSMESEGSQLKVIATSQHSGQPQAIDADIVVLATGFKWQLPSYLSGLKDRIPLDAQGNFLVNRDFSIQWEGPSDNRIYVLNGARHSHGVADPNLSLMAWRSATIINSLLDYPVYDLDGESSAMEWNNPAAPNSGNMQEQFSPMIRSVGAPMHLSLNTEGTRSVSSLR